MQRLRCWIHCNNNDNVTTTINKNYMKTLSATTLQETIQENIATIANIMWFNAHAHCTINFLIINYEFVPLSIWITVHEIKKGAQKNVSTKSDMYTYCNPWHLSQVLVFKILWKSQNVICILLSTGLQHIHCMLQCQ